MIDPINIDEQMKFSIQLEINGDADTMDKPIVRFNLINEKYRLVFDAKRVDNGIYEVEIPELKNILKAGEYNCEFDVFLGNKHFTPVKEKVKLIETVAPKVTIQPKVEQVVENNIVMTIKPINKNKPNMVIEKLDIISK